MRNKVLTLADKLLIGRSEWCQLPNLKIPAIKAKIDTGAKTSAIHAFHIKRIVKSGVDYVNFDIHPIQANDKVLINCQAPITDERTVMSSNGHKEHRYVITTVLSLGDKAWNIELTLSNRDPLRYRLLLGRQALNHRVLIDPATSYNQAHISNKKLSTLYKSFNP